MSRLRGPPHRGVRRISPNLRPDDLPPPIHPITLARHDIPLGMLLPRRLLAERLLDEHRQMEILSAMHHDPVALERLGVLLAAHVRFEERELFEALQRHWELATEPTPPRA